MIQTLHICLYNINLSSVSYNQVQYQDLFDRWLLLTRNLLNRGFLLVSIFPTLIPLLSLFCRFLCITSPNPTDSFLSQPSFTIFAPTIILWHSYSLSFLVSLSNVSFSASNSLSTYFSTQTTSFPFFFLSTAFNIIHSCWFVFIIAISMHKGYFLMFCSFLSSMLWVFSLYDVTNDTASYTVTSKCRRFRSEIQVSKATSWMHVIRLKIYLPICLSVCIYMCVPLLSIVLFFSGFYRYDRRDEQTNEWTNARG